MRNPRDGVTLDYRGHVHILFDDHSYRWFSVKRFAWNGVGDDATLLAALVEHSRYRDHYASRDSHEEDAGNIHGPYWLTAITPGKFILVGTDGAAEVVEEFCRLSDSPTPGDVREQIASTILSWLDRSRWYRLRDLPNAIHDWGFVLLEYRELVAISHETREVLSVVMAID